MQFLQNILPQLNSLNAKLYEEADSEEKLQKGGAFFLVMTQTLFL
jgi:hypothetical protein